MSSGSLSLWRPAWRQPGGACLGLVIGLMLALGQPVRAQPVPAGPSGVQAGMPAGQWLSRIQQAASTRSYQGTLMHNTAGVVSSARVLHYCEGRQTYERLELLDGQNRLQYRHNDQIVTLWPDSKVAQLEQRDPVAQFPALPAAAGVRALDSYDLQHAGQERVAGHEADVLVLKPRDRLRFAQRLWADRETGLLLRTDVLGSTGEVLESSSFADISIGARPQPDTILKPMKKLDGYKLVRPTAVRTQLETEGWVIGKAVPGFQLVSCTRRPLDAGDNASGQEVLQTVFSDGLAQVSVFIERFDPQRHPKAMGTSVGASHTLMSRRGDHWLTVVGEVPMATVQLFEAMLERRR